MNPKAKTPYIVGLMAALLFTTSSVAWSSDADTGEHPRTGKAFPTSTLSCTSNQIPTYNGTDMECGSMETVLPSTYDIAPTGQVIGDLWGLEYVYQIAGGSLNSRTGKGEIVFGQGLTGTITFAYVNPEFIALTVEFGVFGSAPSTFSGILDATTPGSQIFEGDLVDDFGNELTFDFPGLQLY